MSSKLRRKDSAQVLKSLALTAVFASLWIASEMTLGPLVGRLAVGSLSLHGAVNRVLGWFLMTVMTELVGGFGSISLMAAAAALGTRMFRSPGLESIVVGIGYFLGGCVFDVLSSGALRRWFGTSRFYFLGVAVISALVASTPFILWKLTTIGFQAFVLLSPVYALDVSKGVILSSVGTLLELKVDVGPTLRHMLTPVRQE